MFTKLFKNQDLTDDISNSKTFAIVIYSALGLISIVMTIMNIFTKKGLLTVSTGIFAGLCLLNVLLTLGGGKAEAVSKFLFAIEILVLLTFFLVSGNPEGFSAIWICLLPSASMYFFNKRRASVLCGIMLLILVFFLYIPYGNSFLQYEYTESFKMRFPVLFIAFFGLAFFLESRREIAYTEMHRIQDYYRNLSAHDPLTKVLNRQGMYSLLEDDEQYHNSERIYSAMFDIDNFKRANDLYGHDTGDTVLKTFAEVISKNLNGCICRWGGEEFVVVFTKDQFSEVDLEKSRIEFEKHDFVFNGLKFHVTVSVGVSYQDDLNIKEIDSLITKADEALYAAKKAGKNRIVYIPELEK